MIIVIDETPGSPQSARLLHRVLLGGLLLISTLFLLIIYGLDGAPLMPPGDRAATVGWVLAASGLLPIVLGLFILKPRVPMRASGQDDAGFWRVALRAVLSVWVVFESAGIIGAVGGLLTGYWAPAGVVVIALSCLLLMGPGHFENGRS